MSRADVEDDFTSFVTTVEPRLARALVAVYGSEVGHEATRDALVYAWEHWERISVMENPVGYLYRVGQSSSRRYRRRPLLFPEVNPEDVPHVEPKLPEALKQLSRGQRAALVLIHVEGMSERDAAQAMGVSRITVRRHAQRGLTKLRNALEVDDVG